MIMIKRNIYIATANAYYYAKKKVDREEGITEPERRNDGVVALATRPAAGKNDSRTDHEI